MEERRVGNGKKNKTRRKKTTLEGKNNTWRKRKQRREKSNIDKTAENNTRG